MGVSSKKKKIMGHSSKIKVFMGHDSFFSIARKCAPPPVQVNCDRSLKQIFFFALILAKPTFNKEMCFVLEDVELHQKSIPGIFFPHILRV